MQQKTIAALLLIIFTAFILTSCENKDDPEYLLTVDGYKDNFTGYYKINGVYAENFMGEKAHTDERGNVHYYFDKELNGFTSIKIYTFKDSEKCSLTASIWKDAKEVKTITSGENDGYDEESDTYKLALEPLYYETEKEPEELSDK